MNERKEPLIKHKELTIVHKYDWTWSLGDGRKSSAVFKDEWEAYANFDEEILLSPELKDKGWHSLSYLKSPYLHKWVWCIFKGDEEYCPLPSCFRSWEEARADFLEKMENFE